MYESLPILIFILIIYTVVFAVIARRWPFELLAATLVFLLVHELMVRWATNFLHAPPLVVTALSIWKDGALAGMGLVWLLREISKLKIDNLSSFLRKHAVGVAFTLAAVIGIVRIIAAPDRLAALFAFRDYYEPVIVLFVARSFLPTRRQLRRLLTWYVVAVAIIALIGSWQTLFWTEVDYLRWGFGKAISDLGVPPLTLGGKYILRGPSTLSGPNETGMHLVLAMIALAELSFLSNQRQRRVYAGLGAWLSIALAITFSRGDILAFPVGLVLIYVAQRARRRPLTRGALSVHAIILVVLVLATVISGLWGFMADTAMNLGVDYHVIDTAEALAYLRHNPGGIALGQVGPRIGAFFPAPQEVAFHIEGSMFQIAFEFGITGLALWAVFIMISLWQGWQGWLKADYPETRVTAALAVGGGIGSLVVFLFIPLMQSLTMMAWMWFFLGVSRSTVELQATWRSDSKLERV